jgi:hypothetical protein
MAPEQLLAGHVDARTDIFALGSVLYEMITGEKAFAGASQAGVIAAILERDSSADKRRVLAPPGVDRVVRKCLRKDPEERWQSARDLGDEVRWLATSGAGTARTDVAPVERDTKNRRRRFTFRLTIGFSLSILMMAVLSYTTLIRRTPPPTEVALVEQSPAPTVPTAITTSALRPDVDPNRALNEQDLRAARDMIASGNLQGALRDHLQPVLERDPENTVALDLRRTIEDGTAVRAMKQAKVAQGPPPQPEVAGISRKNGEAYADYTARAKRIQVNFAEGKAALDKGDYAAGLARLRLVARDAPKYQGVDKLIADGTARQQSEVDKAIESGQQNEAAGMLMEARRWYERSLQINPSSAIAREKRAAVVVKMNKAAAALFAQGTAALKTGNTQLARKTFQQVYNQTMPGDEYRDKAAKQLQLLK